MRRAGDVCFAQVFRDGGGKFYALLVQVVSIVTSFVSLPGCFKFICLLQHIGFSSWNYGNCGLHQL